MDIKKLEQDIDHIVSRVESSALAPEWQRDNYTEQILALIEPELEKARKWDKVKKILNKKWPAYHMIEAIDALGGEKDALEGEVKDGQG